MLELIRTIFPPVLRYSAMRPDQWQQWHDPLLDDLQPDEHGCGPAVECALVLDFERDGKQKVVIQ